MEVRYCDVEMVQIGNRLRSLDPDKVAALAESMDAIGLQQPISVWSDNIETLELVAGLHRLEAARKLGWEDIDCIFVNLDDLDRQLWEIDENLIRADLTDMERARHTAKRAEVVRQKVEFAKSAITKDELSPKSGVNSKRGPKDKGQDKFVTDTAKKTGRSKASVYQDKARGTKIAEDVQKAIAGTDIENSGVQLDALAAASTDNQRKAVEAVISGHVKDVRDVLHKKRKTKTQTHLDNFNHSVRAVVRMLSSLHGIDVPPLDDGQLSQVEPDLLNAAKALNKFIKIVQRAHDENQAS